MNNRDGRSKITAITAVVLCILILAVVVFIFFSLKTLLSKQKKVETQDENKNILIHKSQYEETESSKAKKSTDSSTGKEMKQNADIDSYESKSTEKPRPENVTKVFDFTCKFEIPLAKKEIFKDTQNGNTIPYRLFVPKNYDSSKRYPVILYLHGAGEIGTDNEKHISYISKLFEYSNDLAEKAFIVCPQTYEWWSLDERYNGDQRGPLGSALHLLKKIMQTYSCDNNRVYVTGISMGGFATWDLLQYYGDIFAAGIPICGGGDPYFADSLKDIPIRIYHGTEDPTVSFLDSDEMYNAIINAGGEKVEMIALEGVGHNAWDYAYVDRDTLCWLFAQDKLSNPTCQYEYIPYFKIFDSNGKTVVSDEDLDGIYYGESYEEKRIVTVDLILNSTGKNKLNNAYLSSCGKEFIVYWLNEKIYAFTANTQLTTNTFSIIDVFDNSTVKCFYKTINKTCSIRR